MKHIIRIMSVLLWAFAAVSCSRMDEAGGQFCGTHIYRMRFDCDIEGSDYAATKAGYVWEDGTVIHIQFRSEGSMIKGVAVYNENIDEWVVEAEESLALVHDAGCEVYWFNGSIDHSSDPLMIGPNVASYKDIGAKYTLFEGGLLIVYARLTPMTSRLRFVGDPGRTFRIDGLKYYSDYSPAGNLFTRTSETLTVTVGDNGSSDYFYVVFAQSNERKLIVEGENQSAFVRSFPVEVLKIGSSGYMTIPSIDDLGKWVLVNSDNSQEILIPQVSETVVSDIMGSSVKLSAHVVDAGNGVIVSSGFVYGKNPDPTLTTALNYACTPSEMSYLKLIGLEKLTTYYVRAYAANPRGLTYGAETTFITTEEDEKLDLGDFEEDEDWGVGESSGDEDDIVKDGWSEDEDWGVGESSGDEDDIVKDGWSEDEDWNGEE